MNYNIVYGILFWMLAIPLFSAGGDMSTQGITRGSVEMQQLEKAMPSDSCHLRIDFPGLGSGQIMISGNNILEIQPDTLAFDQQKIEFDLPIQDTVYCFVTIMAPNLGVPMASGKEWYPDFKLQLVPGDTVHVSAQVERGKATRLSYLEGNPYSRDFIRLEYELLEPDEWTFRQLEIDSAIAGGSIYNNEDILQRNSLAAHRKLIKFAKEHPESYIAEIELWKSNIFLDANDVEAAFSKMPPALQNNKYGKLLRAELEKGRLSRVGAMAPDFTKKQVDGKTFRLSQQRGKYVLLDFWGSWCGSCRASHPHLKKLHQKYKDDVVFVGVGCERTKDLEKAWKIWEKAIAEDGMTWIQVFNNEPGNKNDLSEIYHIQMFPTKILIDPNGKIVARLIGTHVPIDEPLQEIMGY